MAINSNYVLNNCKIINIIGSGNNLRKIIIGNNTTGLGYGVFQDLTNLQKINSDVNGLAIIPDNITHIYSYALLNCKSLTNIIVPNSVTDIESGAF
jgi:hypothetical protein